MGGKAFSNGPTKLSTPRMPPAVYQPLRDECISLLARFFARVACPIEAPEKETYGDIDILDSVNTTTLGQALRAVQTSAISNNPTVSYAIPYPGLSDNFVQLDVHECRDQEFEWEVFHHSHGDIWNLVGSAIRPFGLTANNVGLHVRIAEVEETERKESRLLLTSEPNAVLDLLGLDKEVYWRPFETVLAMFKYVCRSRFFRKGSYVKDTLKANDRKRMRERPLYRDFVEDFVPSLVEEPILKHARETLTRESVFEEVIQTFNRKHEFEDKLRNWRQQKAELDAKRKAKQKRRDDALAAERR